MKNLIIIGNGKSVLNVKKKDFIDSSLVIRLNNFKTEGYEDYVGSRMNFYSCAYKYLKFIDMPADIRHEYCNSLFKESIVKYGHKFTKEQIDEIKPSFFKVHSPPEIKSEKIESIFYLWTDDKSTIKQYPFYDKIQVCDFKTNDPNYSYSTGFRTILYCLNNFKEYKIFVTGFDNFLLSGWYWDDKFNLATKEIRTSNYTDGHPYMLERNKMKEMLTEGLIREI